MTDHRQAERTDEQSAEGTGEWFSAVYRLSPTGDPSFRATSTASADLLDRFEATAIAEQICVEQTIEYPRDLVTDPFVSDRIIAKVDELLGSNELPSWEAVIRYSVDTTGFELPQLLNVLFGNISLVPGIRLERIHLSDSLARVLRGPRLGRAGLRARLGVPNRPLVCTALKPMGLSAEALADLAYRFALGGIDLVKDDHGLSDQEFCRFSHRVELCAGAVDRANRETGGSCLYVPNVTAPVQQVHPRAVLAKQVGAGGLLVSPGLVGFDTMRHLTQDDDIDLPIISHPALLGSYLIDPNQGISHYALLGQMMRMAGADACIFPHFGGRFAFTPLDCRQIAEGTVTPMGPIKPCFPVPAGGMRLEGVPEICAFYGTDVVLLIGGDLHKKSRDLVENCRYFVDLAARCTQR